ncbi:MAG: hypothetical protein H0V76_09095 [Blastocatellia bacterium]|nr:hypothetical protein [Blastocatellia bacterium]
MRYHSSISPKYAAMLDAAVEVILERGNEGHRKTVNALVKGETEIRVVRLDKIGCSGVTGLVNRPRTNRRIRAGHMGFIESLGEVHITFADWTFETAGSRGVEGTLVHEGLHAFDFAHIISSFSRAETDPLEIFDLSLYELERRAAVASGEYLSLIGAPDYVHEGQQLGLVMVDDDGTPRVDIGGIEARMQNGYGVNHLDQGVMISQLLRLRPRDSSFSLRGMLGI